MKLFYIFLSVLFELTDASVWNCNNLCPFAFDKECDDGGVNSTSVICMFGSDCGDCGTRPDYTRRPSIPRTTSPSALTNWTAPPGSLNITIRTIKPTTLSPTVTRKPSKQKKKKEKKKNKG
jgi:hypothetical protein